VVGWAVVLYHNGLDAKCADPKWTSVEFAPGAATWSKKEAGVDLDRLRRMLGREVFVGGRAGVAFLEIDLVKLRAVLGLGAFPRASSMQHEGAAKVLVEIAEA